MRHLLRTVLVLMLLLVWTAARVDAHAYVERSTPADGETLLRPPQQVKIWFSEAIEPKLSSAKLIDSNGTTVAGTSLSVEGGSVFVLNLPALRPGAYTVQWQVLSVDSHVTKGTIRFTVMGQGDQTPSSQAPANRAPDNSAPAETKPIQTPTQNTSSSNTSSSNTSSSNTSSSGTPSSNTPSSNTSSNTSSSNTPSSNNQSSNTSSSNASSAENQTAAQPDQGSQSAVTPSSDQQGGTAPSPDAAEAPTASGRSWLWVGGAAALLVAVVAVMGLRKVR